MRINFDRNILGGGNKMREVMFRGKPVCEFSEEFKEDFKENIKDGLVYGYLIGKDVIVGEIVDWDEEYFATEFWCKVEPSTIGQCTGLTDKNGVEVYEGDFIRTKNGELFIIWWSVFTHGWWARDLGRQLAPEIEWGAVEVVGNVHENPELLGGGQAE